MLRLITDLDQREVGEAGVLERPHRFDDRVEIGAAADRVGDDNMGTLADGWC